MNELPIAEASSVRAGEKQGLRVRDYVQILVITVLVALFLKTFIVEAYRIPSASMENTLRAGDFLLANKFIYGAQTPYSIPFTDYRIPRFRFPGFTSPQRGDLVVFELPEYAREQNTTETTNYVKRCIASAGDTIAIVNRRVVVNGEEFALPESVQPSKRRIFPRGFGDERIFPKGSTFNEDNYGPLAVPKRGDMLTLDADNFMYVRDIVEHEGHIIRLDAKGKILIDGVHQNTYQVEEDYYFMMGDNRDNSLDSRFWGFVPEDLVIGKLMMIYFSVDELNGGFPANVRWGRVGTIVY